MEQGNIRNHQKGEYEYKQRVENNMINTFNPIIVFGIPRKMFLAKNSNSNKGFSRRNHFSFQQLFSVEIFKN